MLPLVPILRLKLVAVRLHTRSSIVPRRRCRTARIRGSCPFPVTRVRRPKNDGAARHQRERHLGCITPDPRRRLHHADHSCGFFIQPRGKFAQRGAVPGEIRAVSKQRPVSLLEPLPRRVFRCPRLPGQILRLSQQPHGRLQLAVGQTSGP